MSLNENEIRPQQLIAGLNVEVEADRLWLAARKQQFVNKPCPACGGAGEIEMTKKDFAYERCQACGTMFMNPRPSEKLLHEFYTQSRTYAYWNKHIFPASETTRREHIFVPRVDRVLDFCKKHSVRMGTLLEIGAGFGTFCEEFAERKLFENVIALEMTPDLAETCRQRGLQVLEQPVEGLSLPDESVDVIAAFETLEHLFSPQNFLEACWRLLAPKGLLVITCPSIEGFDVIALGSHSDTIDHEHLNYFNPRSIRHLAQRAGFRVLEVLTPGKLDADIVRNKALQGTISLSQQPWMQHVLVEQWETVGDKFQQFLADNLMSTHMWMIATRD